MKYRIIEDKFIAGSKYEPEWKGLFFWHKFRDIDGHNIEFYSWNVGYGGRYKESDPCGNGLGCVQHFLDERVKNDRKHENKYRTMEINVIKYP